jgi:hypothetical protein
MNLRFLWTRCPTQVDLGGAALPRKEPLDELFFVRSEAHQWPAAHASIRNNSAGTCPHPTHMSRPAPHVRLEGRIRLVLSIDAASAFDRCRAFRRATIVILTSWLAARRLRMEEAGLGRRRWRTGDESVSVASRWDAAPADDAIQMAALYRPSPPECGDLLDGRDSCGHRHLPSHGCNGS